ncbi:YfjI family protein [Alcanivorax sp. 1008]|uniref:YfjI family protein n=1 Tax=Alcanivorax sp. 1008 TaxID=2816853 RepID=UPI001D509924|nr:YfjI family protein [Alcanivorax sp. 1008]MCC1497941.1 DUF3987 domain-containing protein [Alcanivorax sp. 1008]
MAYPMQNKSQPPADFLSPRLPILGAAVKEARLMILAPDRLCQMGAITAIAIPVPYLIDVQIPQSTQVSITSLYLTAVAKSGEGKTPVEKLFLKAIRDFDDAHYEEYEKQMAQYKRKYKSWNKKKNKLDRDVEKLVDAGKDETEAEEKYQDHLLLEPVKPKKVQLLHEDISPAAMLAALDEYPIGGLVSGEAAMILDGRAFEAFAHFNDLWSGSGVKYERAGKRIRLSGVTLTNSFMIQPTLFEPQTDKRKQKIRDSGYWARNLIFSPDSTQGTRLSRNKSTSTSKIKRFNKRISELLEEMKVAASDPNFKKRILKFSPQAQEQWLEISDQIEMQKGPGGYFERATDHAAKLPEIIARLAALIHYFEGFQGEISTDTLYVAVEICKECSDDFMQLFVKPPEEFADAELLEKRFEEYRERGWRYVERTFARRRCPNPLRQGGRFFIALDRLYLDGFARPRYTDKGVEVIDLCPGQPDLSGFFFVN